MENASEATQNHREIENAEKSNRMLYENPRFENLSLSAKFFPLLFISLFLERSIGNQQLKTVFIKLRENIKA